MNEMYDTDDGRMVGHPCLAEKGDFMGLTPSDDLTPL